MNPPSPPIRTSVKRIVEVIRSVGNKSIVEYYDLNGRLLFVLEEENVLEQAKGALVT